MKMRSTIKISDDLKEWLKGFMKVGETYDDAINRLIDSKELVSEKVLCYAVEAILETMDILFTKEYRPRLAKIRYDYFFQFNDRNIALEVKGDVSNTKLRRGKINEKIEEGYLDYCDYLIVVTHEDKSADGMASQSLNKKVIGAGIRELSWKIQNLPN